MVVQVPEFTKPQSDALLQIFDQIKKNISVSAGEKCRKRKIVYDVLNQLTTIMSEVEPLFKEMFLEFKYTGSYFDGLRIKDANEFDINLVLKLPIRKDKIKLDLKAGPPTYALLAVDNSDGDPTVGLDNGMRGRFQRMLDNGGIVHPEKTLSWMQSVVTKALNRKSELLNKDVKDVVYGKSGPAWTLKITLRDQTETVDVDLVTSFRIEWLKWQEPNQNFKRAIVESVVPAKRRLYLIPKLLPGQSNQYWRKHFPDVEEELLNGKVAAKPVIRILKLLRDNSNWYNVASYYIKTLVMIEVQNTKNNANYWQDSRLPQLVFSMMAKLAECFEKKKLPHLLYTEQNLFQSMNNIELENYFGRMKYILNKCKEDVQNVKLFFLPRSVLNSLEARNQCDIMQPIEVPVQESSWRCAIL